MCLGTNMCVHNRVWAQTCLDTIVSGHKRIWAQSCVGINVCGHKSVWAQSCGYNRVGSSMYGHKRVHGLHCDNKEQLFQMLIKVYIENLNKHFPPSFYFLLNPFSPDGTLKCRFEKFLIFIWKGSGTQIPLSDATMRR